MPETLPLSLIEATIRNLRDHLQHLEAEKAALEQRAAEVRANIRSLEQQLSLSPVSLAETDAPKARRPRGENLRLVKAVFAAAPEAAFTMREIAEKSGLTVSSVQSVLNRDGSGFHKGLDGKWVLDGVPEAAGKSS